MDSPYVFIHDTQLSKWVYSHSACAHTNPDRYKIIRPLDPALDFGVRVCEICGKLMKVPGVRMAPDGGGTPSRAQSSTSRDKASQQLRPSGHSKMALPTAPRPTDVSLVYDQKRNDWGLAHTKCARRYPHYVVKRAIDRSIPLRSDCEICERPLQLAV